MGEGTLDRMCDEANRDWRRACVVADAVVLPTGVRSVAYSNAHSPGDAHSACPDAHSVPSAWPEPYDPAGDSDVDTAPDSLNAGLDRLGDHHQGTGGFGRVDTAQRLDRKGRTVPSDGREPVRGAHREAAMTEPLSSIPDLIEMIRRERDEWKARAEAAEDRLRPRDARVEPPPDTVTPVLLRVAMGMGQTWVPVTLANDGFERMWFSLATTRVYLMDESPYWLPMPPAPEPLSSIPGLIEMIRRERDELRELHRAAEERIPGCGHRRVDWDDSYGGCVACSALVVMREIDAIRRERDLLSDMVATRDGFINEFIAERNAAWKERDEARSLLAELWYVADKCPRCCNLPEVDAASKHLEQK